VWGGVASPTPGYATESRRRQKNFQEGQRKKVRKIAKTNPKNSTIKPIPVGQRKKDQKIAKNTEKYHF